MHEDPLRLMQYNYEEIKALASQFLTLITAVLVFSLAFSEKIIEFRNTGQKIRNLLVSAWSCFFISIIGCGLSLVLNARAGVQMLYGSDRQEAFDTSYQSALALLAAGCVFVAGLAFLILAAFLGRRVSGPLMGKLDG